MRHDGIVINRVPFFQDVSVFAVIDFQHSFQHHDEFLPFVRRERKRVLVRVDVDDERFHVAVCLAPRKRMVMHVLAGVGGVVREADGIVRFPAPADDGARFIVLVIQESAQADSQRARQFQERSQ